LRVQAREGPGAGGRGEGHAQTLRAQGIQLELTAANPAGNGDPNCIDVYKLKATYPNAEWYYSFGPGGQPFTYSGCAEPGKPQHVLHGGARR
jgi:hypothetical protein